MKYDQGLLALPTGPGLGVEFDPNLLEEHEFTQKRRGLHTRHIEAVRARHLDEQGWRHHSMGWHRRLP